MSALALALDSGRQECRRSSATPENHRGAQGFMHGLQCREYDSLSSLHCNSPHCSQAAIKFYTRLLLRFNDLTIQPFNDSAAALPRCALRVSAVFHKPFFGCCYTTLKKPCFNGKAEGDRPLGCPSCLRLIDAEELEAVRWLDLANHPKGIGQRHGA